MTVTPQVKNLTDSMLERYGAWERGEATSPSIMDHVDDALAQSGMDLTTEERQSVADVAYEAQVRSASPQTVATIIVAMIMDEDDE